ncbi:MAG: hypothetical protein J7L77_02405, partial [Clostridiales bacterium]|nr:hypothetical protein [Clostridiales bacterium]
IIGCLLHIFFCAEGYFAFDWLSAIHNHMLIRTCACGFGYAIPGIVLSILVLVPIVHVFFNPFKTVFRVFSPYIWAIYIGLGFRVFSWLYVK